MSQLDEGNTSLHEQTTPIPKEPADGSSVLAESKNATKDQVTVVKKEDSDINESEELGQDGEEKDTGTKEPSGSVLSALKKQEYKWKSYSQKTDQRHGSFIGIAKDKKLQTSSFVHKLYSMLENTELDDVIWWHTDQCSFFVSPTEEFTKVLSVYFKHANIASFIRQLNMYGFHKVSDGSTPGSGSRLSVASSCGTSGKGKDGKPDGEKGDSSKREVALSSTDNSENGSAASSRKTSTCSVANTPAVWEFRHSSSIFRRGNVEGLAMIKRRSFRNTNAGKEVHSIKIPYYPAAQENTLLTQAFLPRRRHTASGAMPSASVAGVAGARLSTSVRNGNFDAQFQRIQQQQIQHYGEAMASQNEMMQMLSLLTHSNDVIRNELLNANYDAVSIVDTVKELAETVLHTLEPGSKPSGAVSGLCTRLDELHGKILDRCASRDIVLRDMLEQQKRIAPLPLAMPVQMPQQVQKAQKAQKQQQQQPSRLLAPRNSAPGPAVPYNIPPNPIPMTTYATFPPPAYGPQLYRYPGAPQQPLYYQPGPPLQPYYGQPPVAVGQMGQPQNAVQPGMQASQASQGAQRPVLHKDIRYSVSSNRSRNPSVFDPLQPLPYGQMASAAKNGLSQRPLVAAHATPGSASQSQGSPLRKRSSSATSQASSLPGEAPRPAPGFQSHNTQRGPSQTLAPAEKSLHGSICSDQSKRVTQSRSNSVESARSASGGHTVYSLLNHDEGGLISTTQPTTPLKRSFDASSQRKQSKRIKS